MSAFLVLRANYPKFDFNVTEASSNEDPLQHVLELVDAWQEKGVLAAYGQLSMTCRRLHVDSRPCRLEAQEAFKAKLGHAKRKAERAMCLVREREREDEEKNAEPTHFCRRTSADALSYCISKRETSLVLLLFPESFCLPRWLRAGRWGRGESVMEAAASRHLPDPAFRALLQLFAFAFKQVEAGGSVGLLVIQRRDDFSPRPGFCRLFGQNTCHIQVCVLALVTIPAVLYELQGQEPSTAKKLLLQAAAAYFHGLRAAYSIDHVAVALGLNPGQEDVSITMLDLLAKAGLAPLFEGSVLSSNAPEPRSFDFVLLAGKIPEDLTEAVLEHLRHSDDEALSLACLPELLFCDFQATTEAATIPELVTLEGQTYRLQSVMVHEGPSHHCGHYFCFVFDPMYQRWCHIDDGDCQFVKAPPAAQPASGLKIIFRRASELNLEADLVPSRYRELVWSDNFLCHVEHCLLFLTKQVRGPEFQEEFQGRCVEASAILDTWRVHPPSELEGRLAHWFVTCRERERIRPQLLVLMCFDSFWRPCLPEFFARPMECFEPLYETFGLGLAGGLILGQIATGGLDTYKPSWKEWIKSYESTVRYVVYRDALLYRLEGQKCCRLSAFVAGDSGRACHEEFDALLHVAAWLCQWEPSRDAIQQLVACLCTHALTPELRLRLCAAVRRFRHLCDEREQKAMLTAIQWQIEDRRWQAELPEFATWAEEHLKKLADVSFPETMSLGPARAKNANAQPGPELLELLRARFPLA